MLTCNATHHSDELRVQIGYRNESSSAVWVAASLPRWVGAHATMDPQHAYVWRDGDSTMIGRCQLDVPADIDVEAPERPGWIRIDAGGVYRGEIRIPWPARTHHPYLDDERVALRSGAALQCVLGTVTVAKNEAEAPLNPGSRQYMATAPITVHQP